MIKESFRIISSEEWDYNKIKSYSLGLKKRLHDLGISKGDHVGILSENSTEYIIIIITLIDMGVVFIPLNFRFSNIEIMNSLNRFRCKMILHSKRFRNISVRQNKGEIEYLFEQVSNDKIDESQAFMRNLDLESASNIILSSGSTGESKGVVHCLSNHIASAEGSNENIKIDEESIWNLSLPLFHIGGLAILFRCMRFGSSVELIDDIKNSKASHFSFVLTQIKRLIDDWENSKHIFNNVKAILLGGSAIPDRIVEESIKLALPIHKSYGSSEMSSQITTTTTQEPNDLTSSGKVLPNRELEIIDSGEIIVRGKTLFLGYYKDGMIEKDLYNGWFASGDLGKFDNDGNLHVLGRIDRMFISGGENIHPEKIEKAIKEFPGVENCQVIPFPDSEFGYRPFAKVHGEFDETKLENHLRNNLSKFEIPMKIVKDESISSTSAKDKF